MSAVKFIGIAVVIVGLAATAHGQPYELGEKTNAGDCWNVQLTMNLTGEMKISRDDKRIPLKIAATAKHAYAERAMAVDASGILQKSARHYETAQAFIGVGGDRSERKLRDERRLLVAQQYQNHRLVYSPSGPLTRAEMELTSEHFDTLALAGLLPGKAVKIGETWKVSNDAAQILCCFEGLSTQDVVCKLEEVKDNQARVSVTGSATGIELGAFIKLTITAGFHFDLATRRIVALEWKQKDERDQGPASPATSFETTTTLKRTPIATPDTLSDAMLVPVPDGLQPPAPLSELVHQHDGTPRYTLNYSRDWTLTGQTRDHTVFRLMERGDFVAQATVTPWDAARPGEHLSPAQFREAMAKTPGWHQAEIVQEGEIPAVKGYWIYRIAAAGEMDGMRVIQNFFLIAGPSGGQLVVVFTMSPNQVEKIGARDIEFARGIELADTSKK